MKLVIFACVLILIQSIYSASLGIPVFEIREGNCTRAVASDLVFQKHVHLTRIPLTTREDTVS